MLTINSIVKKYETKHIGPISAHVEDGEVLAVMGPSGSGKTTLINVIAAFTKGDTGKVLYCDQPLERSNVMYISQDGTLFDHLTITENLAFTFSGDDAEISKVFGDLNLDPKYVDRYPFELSGGEKQRVDIARAILSKSKILIMDEVFSALDSRNRESISDLIIYLKNEYNLIIILITHDIYDALYIADKLLLIKNGQQLFTGDPQDVINSNYLVQAEILTEKQLARLRSTNLWSK